MSKVPIDPPLPPIDSYPESVRAEIALNRLKTAQVVALERQASMMAWDTIGLGDAWMQVNGLPPRLTLGVLTPVHFYMPELKQVYGWANATPIIIRPY